MPRRFLAPCLDCGQLSRNGSRCGSCQGIYDHGVNAARGSATARGYGHPWQDLARAVLAEHKRRHGNVCPGWQRPAHPADSLTVDHWIPKRHGGSDDRGNLWVLCVACNSTKGDSVPDEPRPPGR